jgi:hypothetical protein
VRLIVPIALVVAFAALAGPSAAQTAAAGSQVRVYLDCSWLCDFDFIRTEIDWVDWMRDRADAQIHVLVTSQPTGGGGREFTLDFIGLRDFAGKGDTLRYIAGRDNSADDTRRGLTRTLSLGLARYAAQTASGELLMVRLADPPAGRAAAATAAAQPASDPWNHWTFSIGGSGFFDGESTRSGANLNTNLRASRITHAWKTDFRINGSYRESSFTYPTAEDRDTTILSIFRNYGANMLVVRSVTGNLSLGARAGITTSTFGNTRHAITVGPAIEYNVFPYAESTRRAFALQYGPGVVTQEYREVTIFDQDAETRMQHSATASLSTRQQWGDINLSLNGSQYLHDTSLYQFTFFGGSSVNLFRGLRLNFFGNYQMIRDQLSLPKRDATPEEVLLRQRQLRTNFRYWGNIGLSYRFGSRVQNIVNPRFATGSGGVVIFDGF